MTYGLGTSGSVAANPKRPRLARLALGMAALAGERLGANTTASGRFATALGLAQQGADQARGAVDRITEAGARVTRRAQSRVARILPGPQVLDEPLRRTRERLSQAEVTGRATVAAGRADALAFLRTAVADGVAWAQVQVIPKVVDSLVPHLVSNVVPRLIDGAMPEIRERVLPVVIEDLTSDPKIRELVVEQSRGVAGEAAANLRVSSATADDRVESAFRRLIGREPTSELVDLEPTSELVDLEPTSELVDGDR